MSMDNEELKTAIDDVNVVAGELRELRQNIQHYGEAAKRLDRVSDSLVKLGDSMTSIQRGIEHIVHRAEQVHVNLESSRNAVDTMTATIPDVVARIEASDSSKSGAEFLKMLSETRDLILSQQSVVRSMQLVVDNVASMSKELRFIKDETAQQTQLMQLVNQALMQNVATPVNENTRLLNALEGKVQDMQKGNIKVAEGVATLTVRLCKEIEALKSELSSLRGDNSTTNDILVDYGAKIETLSKKKGIFF